MLIYTRALGFDLTNALSRHVESRFASTLRPFARALLTVIVRLEDVNAGRGGIDKRCSCVAALRGGHKVVVAEATRDDLYAAIADAAERTRRSVLCKLTRHVDRERRDPQRPGTLVKP